MKINIYTSHPSAFISSTFIDLEEERNAVANVLRASNLNINALDVKPASNDSSRKEILTGIKESDFIILIIGERYGSIIPRMTLSKKFSITRWEYVRAVQTYNKHVLVYFKKVESNDPMYYDDSQSDDFEIKRMHLAAFKKELSNAHNPKYFTTTEELAEEVRKAIIPTYRAGVKSLSAKNEALTKELEALKLENQRLTVASTTIADGSRAGLSDFAKTRSKGLLGMVNDGQDSISNNASGLGLLSQFTNRENKK
jgi:hypothetical protein